MIELVLELTKLGFQPTGVWAEGVECMYPYRYVVLEILPGEDVAKELARCQRFVSTWEDPDDIEFVAELLPCEPEDGDLTYVIVRDRNWAEIVEQTSGFGYEDEDVDV